MKERRRAERKQEVNPVVITLFHEGIEADGLITHISLTENMSIFGLKIVANTFILVGSLFEFELSLIWSFKTIHLTGKVVWINSLTDKFFEMGVEIVDASKEDIQILTEHLMNSGR